MDYGAGIPPFNEVLKDSLHPAIICSYGGEVREGSIQRCCRGGTKTFGPPLLSPEVPLPYSFPGEHASYSPYPKVQLRKKK